MISFEKPLNALEGLQFHFNVVCAYIVFHSDNNSPIVKNNLILQSTDRSSEKGNYIHAQDVQNGTCPVYLHVYAINGLIYITIYEKTSHGQTSHASLNCF